ncbi:unnamed protein product [Polarella glacialis]|uniref:Uncharacterized protein n=1 Tax=Polarella glacialis TaxID=89957 RepID=A0A813DPA3_POLGL|nr:unnamed protein product [Polarella glacialis]
MCPEQTSFDISAAWPSLPTPLGANFGMLNPQGPALETQSSELKPQRKLEVSAAFLEEARRQLSKLKVKNTFIDVPDSEDEDDDRPPMKAVKSCPAGGPHCAVEDAFLDPAPIPQQVPRTSTAPAQAPVQSTSPQRQFTSLVGCTSAAQQQARTVPGHGGQPRPPCLLRSSRQLDDGKNSSLAYPHKVVKVKNTFINVEESDDDEDRQPMVARTKSLPVRSADEAWPTSPSKGAFESEEELSGPELSLGLSLRLSAPTAMFQHIQKEQHITETPCFQNIKHEHW